MKQSGGWHAAWLLQGENTCERGGSAELKDEDGGTGRDGDTRSLGARGELVMERGGAEERTRGSVEITKEKTSPQYTSTLCLLHPESRSGKGELR